MADRAAGGGCGTVALGNLTGAFEGFDGSGGEHLRNQPHAGVRVEIDPVRDGDAGGLLPAVLLGVEPEIDQPHGVRVAPHADDAALVLGTVVEDRQLDPVGHAREGYAAAGGKREKKTGRTRASGR